MKDLLYLAIKHVEHVANLEFAIKNASLYLKDIKFTDPFYTATFSIRNIEVPAEVAYVNLEFADGIRTLTRTQLDNFKVQISGSKLRAAVSLLETVLREYFKPCNEFILDHIIVHGHVIVAYYKNSDNKNIVIEI